VRNVVLFCLAALAFLGCAGLAEYQAVPPSGSGAAKTYLFSANVELVVLNASVRDRSGWFVSGLSPADFDLSEDRVPQTIKVFRHEDVPVTVGLVVDHSGSMEPKLTHVIAAARTFVEQSRSDDDMFVVNFNEKVTVELGANRHSNRPDELAVAIASRPTQGQTALYDAVDAALQQLQTSGREKKVLIVISDGGDNASKHKLGEVLKRVEESSAVVYTIGIFENDDPDKNPDVLRRLAHITGGEAFFPHELSEVVAICERIAHDIRNQYTVGYVSSNVAQPGAYRSIKLVARAAGKGKLSVRTRAGYMVGERAK
jgi:VWFA-related protein